MVRLQLNRSREPTEYLPPYSGSGRAEALVSVAHDRGMTVFSLRAGEPQNVGRAAPVEKVFPYRISFRANKASRPRNLSARDPALPYTRMPRVLAGGPRQYPPPTETVHEFVAPLLL